MKLLKRFSLLAVAVFAIFAFVSCGEYQVLNDVDRITSNFSDTSKDMTDFDSSNLGNDLVTLSYETDSQVMLLSDEEQTPLQLFIELRRQVIELHAQNMIERTNIIALRMQIKDAVDYIKGNQIMLLDDDKANIQQAIDSLKELRQNLLDTRGQAYQKLIDWQGNYTRENLPEINETYQEVIPVLESRHDMFQQATSELQTIYDILSDYME